MLETLTNICGQRYSSYCKSVKGEKKHNLNFQLDNNKLKCTSLCKLWHYHLKRFFQKVSTDVKLLTLMLTF